MSLCFREAFARYRGLGTEKGTREEYLDNILAHLRGIRHPADTAPSNSDLHAIEPWTRAFREVALAGDYEPLKDTSGWAKLFDACVDGNLDTFKTALEKLDTSRPPNPVQPAACLAAQHSNHQILDYCFAHHNADMDKLLHHSCRTGAKTAGMMQTMYEQDWNSIRTSPEATRKAIAWFGPDSLQGHWLRAHALPAGDSGSGPAQSGPVAQGQGTQNQNPQGRPTPEQLEEWFGDVDW